MKIRIADLYSNDDAAEFKYLPEAWAYYHYYERKSKGKWFPLIMINRKMISFEKFRKMCRKVGV